MAYYGKVFTFQSSENHEDFLNSLGLSAEKAEFFKKFKPDQKIEKTGDTYVFTFNTPRGDKALPFTSGVEFEDKARNLSVKNTFTVDGDTVTHVMKFDSGLVVTAKKEFSDAKMIETLSNSKWDGEATVTYSV